MANQESRRLFKSYNVQCGNALDPEVITDSQKTRDNAVILKKRIFKSFSFQKAREYEDVDCTYEKSECCPEECLNMLTILHNIDEAQCFELLVKEPKTFKVKLGEVGP